MLHVNQTVKSRKAIVKSTAMVSKTQRGVALLESLIAILVFSTGILAIAGLQGFMVKDITETKIRSDASFLAQNRIAMMWASPANLAAFAEVATSVPSLPNGVRKTVITPVAGLASTLGSEVVVTITWQQPGEAQHKYRIIARIAGA